MTEQDWKGLDPQFVETLQGSMSLAGVDDATIERDPGATVVPRSWDEQTDPEVYFRALIARARPVAECVELRTTLGEGGMSVVQLGRQRSLDRAVAVKRVKDESNMADATMRLLREAWVTAQLDHPNIVPIYDTVAGEDGTPQIVLKHIEGVAWSVLMRDAEEVLRRFGVDLLEWNIGILIQVCHAVGFAHSRGVLHRDIKPDNVMIGTFGEVYLVDWGLAVALDERMPHLPSAAHAANVIAGTPWYMSPEMLGGRAARLTEHTDVYLLGAVLYEIATGRPPHEGSTFVDIVSSVLLDTVELPSSTPAELSAVVLRAMRYEAADRYPSVDDLRHALRACLKHMDAGRIAQRGMEHLGRLAELVSLPAGAKSAPPDDEVYRTFVECRTTFRSALDAWAEHPGARHGITTAATMVARYLVRKDNPELASTLLSEVREPPADIVEMVQQELERKASESNELLRLRDETDLERGRTTRLAAVLVIGTLWTTLPPITNFLMHRGVITPGQNLWRTVGLLVVVVLVVGAAHRSLRGTRINRAIVVAALAAMVGIVAAQAVTRVTGLSAWHAIHQQLMLFAGITTMTAMAGERWLAIPAVTYFLGYLMTPFLGVTNALYVIGACNLVLTVVCAIRWGGRSGRASSLHESVSQGPR